MQPGPHRGCCRPSWSPRHPRVLETFLSRSYPFVDRESPAFNEQRRLNGGSLFNFKYEAWLPRRRVLQPVFTKQHVMQFAGHMAESADKLSQAWGEDAEVDLDQECRRLTLRVLARSVLGLDIDARADTLLGEPLRTMQKYVRRSRRPAGPRPLVVAYARPAARTRRQRHVPATRRRHSPKLPGRPDSRRTTGSRADRRR